MEATDASRLVCVVVVGGTWFRIKNTHSLTHSRPTMKSHSPTVRACRSSRSPRRSTPWLGIASSLCLRGSSTFQPRPHRRRAASGGGPWGQGACGKLGHGDEQNQLLPKKVEAFTGQRVVAVSAGARHSLAIATSGAGFTWGKGEYGRLPRPRRGPIGPASAQEGRGVGGAGGAVRHGS